MEMKSPVILRKTSLIDFPGLISGIIFFPGCNLRCPWCYNRELVLGQVNSRFITLEKALSHIEKRRNVLGGIVLSGGEPTLYAELNKVIKKIKSFGLKVKLDTNGTLPDVLKKLFSANETRPDFIAMDLKTNPDRYLDLLPEKTPDTKDPGQAVQQSAAMIRSSGITHEFRSLVLPEPYFNDQTRTTLASLAGESSWHIRPFIPENCLNPSWNER